MKIDTSKITGQEKKLILQFVKPGIAVHLDGTTPEERIAQQKILVDAFGLKRNPDNNWADWDYWWLQKKSYTERGWNAGVEKSMRDYCTAITKFSSIFGPNLIKALHAVGVGDWLQSRVKFYFGKTCYDKTEVFYINEKGTLMCINKYVGSEPYVYADACKRYSLVLEMFKHPEDIKPLPKWTDEEQEMAKAGLLVGLTYIAKNKDGSVMMFVGEPTYTKVGWCNRSPVLYAFEDTFINLQPGECVALEEIAGGK